MRRKSLKLALQPPQVAKEIFWAVVGRELRVAARRRSTYWTRAVAVLLVAAAHGRSELVLLEPTGDVVWASPTALMSASVTGHGESIFLANRDPPFEAVETSCADSAGQWKELPVPSAVDRRASTKWRALPVFPLHEHRIRTFADITSDDRVVAIYDGDGNLGRHQRFSVPLGFVGACCDGIVLAFRRLNRPEIVAFKVEGSSP